MHLLPPKVTPLPILFIITLDISSYLFDIKSMDFFLSKQSFPISIVKEIIYIVIKVYITNLAPNKKAPAHTTKN